MSDEFYLAAHVDPPEADFYDGYPQFYDGIGMIRAYLDEAEALLAGERERLDAVHRALADEGRRLLVVSGAAAQGTVARLVEAPPLLGEVRAIENRYFGGNVDVTGLICGGDLLDQLPGALSGHMVILPDVMFNADRLTLDGYHQDALLRELEGRGASMLVAPTMPGDLLDSLERTLGIER